MKIKELGIDERPVERLLEKGAGALSNVEILAVLLHSGTAGLNAMDVARLALSHAEGSLVRLSSMSADKLREIPGIGPKKAASLSASFELARRFAAEGTGIEKKALTGPDMVYRTMLPRLKGLPHEECWVIYLNRANYIIGKEMVTRGGFTSTTIDIRMLVIKAMEKKACGIIVVHNHPSGNPRPGDADISQTKLLKEALSPMGIDLLDHIIVCDDCYFSFADERIATNSIDSTI